MAEIGFFATEDEIVEVVTWLLDHRCLLVPDIHYDSDVIARLTQLSEIREMGGASPHFFVIREDLLDSPLSTRRVTTADKSFFYIDPRTGGPSLQFYWGRYVENERKPHLSATWLSYYSWYQDSLTGERKKVSRGLLDVYRECEKMIRATRKRIQPGKREFWVSPIVEEVVRGGAVLLGFEGMPAGQILGISKEDRETVENKG
jgi:hypothetical protein